MIFKVVLTFSLVVFTLVAFDYTLAGIYKWRDHDGKLHFTDSPDKIPAQYKNNVKVEKAFKDEAKEEKVHDKPNKDADQGIVANVDYKSIKITIGSTRYGSKWAKTMDAKKRRLTWRATISNHNDYPATVMCKVNFLDSLGNVVHEQRVTMKRVKAHGRKVFRDYVWADRTLAEHVVKASVQILRKIKVKDKESPIQHVIRFGSKYGAVDFSNISDKAVVFSGKIIFIDKWGFAIGKSPFNRKYLPPGGEDRSQLVEVGKSIWLKQWNEIDVIIDTYKLTSSGAPKLR